jgi:hypothetical protein
MCQDSQATSYRGRRAVLSHDQVVNIYKLRNASCSAAASKKRDGIGATSVARCFGVSSKTVRDIWVGRTWYRATQHLDPLRTDATERLQKRLGRPKGAKDRKPRIGKFLVVDMAESKSQEVPFPADFSTGLIQYSHPLQSTGPACYFQYNSETCCLGATGEYNILNLPAQWPPATTAAANDHQSFLVPSLENTLLSAFEDPFHNDWAFWPPTPVAAT